MASLTGLFGDLFVTFLVLAFVAAALLAEGLYLAWKTTRSPEAKKVERRLHALAAGATTDDDEGVALLKQRMLSGMPSLQRLLLAMPRMRALDRTIEQSGVDITVSRLLAISAALGAAVLSLGLLPAVPSALAAGLAAVAASLPFVHVGRARTRRLQTIDRQLPDALDLMGRALRAGHAFSAGLQMVSEEMPDPIGGEFRIAHEEVNFGVSLQQALMNLATRIPSTDLNYFVVAVMIQRESGGNLTEVLGNLSALIRERFKLFEKVRVLSAEGTLSAWILSLLPFGVAGVINLLNPAFMQVLWTDPMGIKMIGTALGIMAIGIFWMRRIVRIHV